MIVRGSKLAPTLSGQMKPTHAKIDFDLKSKIDTPGLGGGASLRLSTSPKVSQVFR